MPNNVNAEAMEAFRMAVKADPAEARKEKRVEGSWSFKEGGAQFVGTLPYPKGDVELTCELPPFAGGWGGAPDPVLYCLYGLAACYATTFVAAATAEGVALRAVKVTAENALDLRKQLGLSEDPIVRSVRFVLDAESDAPRETLERLKVLADERCPGVECVTTAIPLETALR